MQVHAAALEWGLKRIFLGRQSNIRDIATGSREISPAVRLKCPPAIFTKGALDKIKGLSPWRNWETERLFIEGGTMHHAATTALVIENVKVAGAHLYCGRARAQEGFGPLSLIRKGKDVHEHMETAALVSNWAGSHFFGTFMRGAIPQELLPEEGETAISLVTKPYVHEADYRAMLNLPRPTRVVSAHIDQLTLYNDFGQNTSKATRLVELRRRMRQSLGKSHRSVPGVYLKRGATGETRLVSNEAEVEEKLLGLGFDIVEPSSLSGWEVSKRLLDAPIVVSVEGSHMAHAIYSMAENGALVVLQPPDRFAMAYKEFTDRVGMRFAFTVGNPSDNNCFEVDIADLERTLDLL